VNDRAQSIRDRFRKHSGELSLLLWAVWNPIGDVPLDEYEGYVPQVWKLLEERADVDSIEAALTRICQESMDVDGGTNRDAAEIASRWWYWRFDYPEEMASETQ
jgi:hypothetical protein